MDSPNVFNDKWSAAEEEAKKASVGMFLAQGLRTTGDHINIAFVQAPIARLDKFGNNKIVANVALFNEETGEYQKLGLLEMAPSHWKGFLARRTKFGGDQLFQIERQGIPDDKKTRYDCDPIRALTADEQTMLAALDLIDIHKEGSAEASDEAWLDEFRRTCGAEWERLGWDKEQGKLSITTLFGKFIPAADQDVQQRIDYIGALKQLKKGDGPECCTGLPATIDLDADDEF